MAKTAKMKVVCGCFEVVNAELKKQGTSLRRDLVLNRETMVAEWTKRAFIATEKKSDNLMATYCPFCGKKYK